MQRILTQSSVLLVLSQWSVTCSCRSLRVSCNHSVILQPYMQASTVIVSTLLFIPSPLSVPSHRVFNFVRWYETHKLLSPGQKQISTQSSSIRSYANGKWSVWPVDRVTLHEICETQNNPTPRFFFSFTTVEQLRVLKAQMSVWRQIHHGCTIELVCESS